MNLILLEQDDFIADDKVSISGERLQHIHSVLNAKAGDELTIGVVNGNCGKGRIIDLDDHKATLEVSLDTPPPPSLPLIMILALPRPKMLRRILRTVAELGIKELHLVNSYRVEKSYWQTPALEPATIKNYFKQGLEQSKDTIMPEIYLHTRFKPFAEDICPGIIDNKEAFVAHPYTENIKPEPSSKPRVVAIGPEGGFIDYEIDLLTSLGFSTFSMGQRIYRVENAIPLVSSISFCKS